MTKLTQEDLCWCVRRLPTKLNQLLRTHGSKLFVAGGFIRSCITREPVNDIDVFTDSKEAAKRHVMDFSLDSGVYLSETDNAFTLHSKPPVQFIHRWTFDNPATCVESFDFTIARAAIWFDKEEERWESVCDDRFYSDLAARRLVYCSPKRIEEVGGSLLRVLKFYQQGYRIPIASLAAVCARLVSGIEGQEPVCGTGLLDEEWLTQILAGLLREVDPLTPLETEILTNEETTDGSESEAAA